ncbi:aminodeoxychorismate lyase [Methylophaga sp.]|uniref:aminodeoxychorismate lyase n=1 Tax=Methylophaga sp. TaxID=2024840 RepID=UPI003F69D62D
MILINGQPENRIPVSDRGLQYGDGLFETLAFRRGELEFLESHLSRLKLGCDRLNFHFTRPDSLKAELATLCAQTAEDSVIKVILTRGSGGRGYKAPTENEPIRIISSHIMPDYPQTNVQGVTVRMCDARLGLNPSLAGIKHLNRLEQVLARSEWDDPAISEGLMFDINDNLIEGTMSNLFIVKNGQLLTPPINQAGIAGIMRAEVLKLAEKNDIATQIKPLSKKDLLEADEVFLTNSIITIWPVTALTGTDSIWPHGPITRQLQTVLESAAR